MMKKKETKKMKDTKRKKERKNKKRSRMFWLRSFKVIYEPTPAGPRFPPPHFRGNQKTWKDKLLLLHSSMRPGQIYSLRAERWGKTKDTAISFRTAAHWSLMPPSVTGDEREVTKRGNTNPWTHRGPRCQLNTEKQQCWGTAAAGVLLAPPPQQPPNPPTPPSRYRRYR